MTGEEKKKKKEEETSTGTINNLVVICTKSIGMHRNFITLHIYLDFSPNCSGTVSTDTAFN